MKQELAAGATNCVADCARVKAGNQVYVLNEEGAAEPAVSDAIVAAIEAQGARPEVVWGPALGKGSTEIPHSLLNAYRQGDVVISHYPSLRREALQVHVQGERRARATNRALTAALLASEWARFPYTLQLAIIQTLDEIFSKGKTWRITSPAGTDLAGEFGGAGSAVAEAYFVKGEDNTRASRNFPGGVHAPAASAGIRGIIVAEHATVSGSAAMTTPLRLEIEDNRVVSIQGGDDAGTIKAALEQTDGFLDSWHAGTNPKTVVPYERATQPRPWWTNAHCHPSVLHFHLGRSHAPVNLATFRQTLSVDGRKVYDAGRLAILDHPRIQAATQRFGDPDRLLAHDPIVL